MVMSMIFYYHLFIGEVRTIRNETRYSIHGKHPLNQVRNLRNLNHLIYMLDKCTTMFVIFSTYII